MAIFKNKEDIFELIDKFEKSALTEIDIKVDAEDNVKINMKKFPSHPHIVPSVTSAIHGGAVLRPEYPTHPAMADDPSSEAIVPTEVELEKESGEIIKAPLIGVYYSAPSPDSEPFVSVGKKISKGGILCIIEAMKVMNEIESEIDGEITEIFVKNGESVEFGQPLFRID